jgi:hypothetical protein
MHSLIHDWSSLYAAGNPFPIPACLQNRERSIGICRQGRTRIQTESDAALEMGNKSNPRPIHGVDAHARTWLREAVLAPGEGADDCQRCGACVFELWRPGSLGRLWDWSSRDVDPVCDARHLVCISTAAHVCPPFPLRNTPPQAVRFARSFSPAGWPLRRARARVISARAMCAR